MIEISRWSDNKVIHRHDGADLCFANLRGVDLRDANLYRADLRNATLRDANLRDADLQNADLQGTDLRGTKLQGTDLRGTKLQGTDLRGTRGYIDLGIDPRGYHFRAVLWHDGWRVNAGCRWFTVPEAEAHWTNQNNMDALARVAILKAHPAY